MKCKYKHHKSICDRPERESSNPDGVSLTVYTNYAEEEVLPAIIAGNTLLFRTVLKDKCFGPTY